MVPSHVSLQLSTDAAIRRANRVLTMVLELHKAGYQRLRICAGHALDGKSWICRVLPASDLLSDGWTPRSSERAAVYKTVDSVNYFEWTDASGDNARELAAKFTARFPATVHSGIGEDWEYSGWLVGVLGLSEAGMLPSLFGGYAYERHERPTVLPPSLSGPGVEVYVGTGYPIVPHEMLKLEDVPAENAPYERLVPFCLSFDGYRLASLLERDVEEIAEETERRGLTKSSMEALRVTAFAKQRAIKWSGSWPPHPSQLGSIRAVVSEIRRRLLKRQSA